MTHRGIVVPADPEQPVRLMTWERDGDLIGALEHAIHGASPADGYLDSSPQIRTPAGPICMWVGDESLLADPVVHNPRALGLCHVFGYLTPAVGGTAVFTGGADEMGEQLPFPDELLALIGLAQDPGAMAAYDALSAAGITITAEAAVTHPDGD